MTKRIIFPILCTLSCLLTLMACLEEKDPLNYSPNVATGTATDIGYTNATLSGTIRQNTGTHIADGGIHRRRRHPAVRAQRYGGLHQARGDRIGLLLLHHSS